MVEHKSLSAISGADAGWLKARHHFAIGRFGNPKHKPVGSLYVLNDDEIQPGTGFGMHSHVDVEIVTYVRAGSLRHEDSLGHRGELEAGDVQVISAGTGIQHSESNPGKVPTKIFQLWLQPPVVGGEPQYGTQKFPDRNRAGQFITLASGRGDKACLELKSEVEVLGASLNAGSVTSCDLRPHDLGYLVVSSGTVTVNGVRATTGEGAALRDEATLVVEALEDAELVFVVTAP